jgi:hypothetical protein
VLFRPEEIHGASGIWKSLRPFCERDGNITHDSFRVGL